MLVSNNREWGKRKLADKWDGGVYTVIGVNPAIHVYKIRDVSGCTMVVHRNLLLEVNFFPLSGMDHSNDTNDTDQLLVCSEAEQDSNWGHNTALPSEMLIC